MPYTEMLKWIDYFKKRPVGWRDDHRTYMLLRAQGVKEKPENVFASLKQIEKYRQESQEDDKAMPQGKILEMMLKAKNGDSSGWKPKWGRPKNESKS
jgi:hypothetical protein